LTFMTQLHEILSAIPAIFAVWHAPCIACCIDRNGRDKQPNLSKWRQSMTITTNFFSRVAALATAAALSFVMISGTVATPSPVNTTSANVSVMA
jgi:hypothetical protein